MDPDAEEPELDKGVINDDDDQEDETLVSQDSFLNSSATTKDPRMDLTRDFIDFLTSPDGMTTMEQLHGSRNPVATTPSQANIAIQALGPLTTPTAQAKPITQLLVGPPIPQHLPEATEVASDFSNMTNLGSTCYLSSALQVMHRVPALRSLVAEDYNYSPYTGRNVKDILNVDISNSTRDEILALATRKLKMYKDFIDALRHCFSTLDSSKSKLSAGVTINILVRNKLPVCLAMN
jgi:hypothetical protein